MTVNPSDIHNPIAQYFAEAEIDLDSFCPGIAASVSDRAAWITQDPYAAAKFFYTLIGRLLDDVFGIKGA